MKPLIKPIGVGDLKVTKQRLIRYAPGEVAHIENVLAREKRSREHRRLRRQEETLTFEREREEESRRDLQSTERFELQSETQRTLRSETTFEAGLELSASYGPVSLNAFARFATNEAKEESDTASTKYAKEITEKSLSRLAERVREERVSRTVEETEETNTHGFDNTDSPDHVTGVYRWVDKFYRQKVVNYGKRLMFEFVVPEPAAFYLFAQRYHFDNKVLPDKPQAPALPDSTIPLHPSAITRTNYLGLVKQQGAQGVEPPPVERLVVSKPLSREIPPGGAHFAFTNEDLVIPKGYVVESGFYRVAYTWNTGDADVRSGTLLVGNDLIDIGVYPSLALSGESGKVPISGTGFGLRTFAINVQAVCVLLAEEFARWQLSVFTAVMNAYRQQLLDYEERLAALQIQQAGRIGGTNPAINREIEKEELKHACLILWAGDALDLPAAITHNPQAPPPGNHPAIRRLPAIANAESIEFFEQAFEWSNVVYELYPYFWGRKDTWLDRNALQSEDPLLERFLKAGAARVVVPVRPSFTEAVLWYQITGQIWTGGAIPALSSTGDPDAVLFNSYLEEMRDVEDVVELDAEIDIPEDDPAAWTIKVPTTLVWLQPEPGLPELE